MQMISYFGPEGSFTHEAALRRFGNRASLDAVSTIAEVFNRVKSDDAKIGLVPLYNTTGGFVNDTVDVLLSPAFVRAGCQINEEMGMDIRLCLMGIGNPRKIQRIYSHAYPIKYSKDRIARLYPKASVIVTESTSEAAIKAKTDKESAAIGSESAANRYGLKVWEVIRGKYTNTTHFISFSKEESVVTSAPRTALGFGLNHQPGTLATVLRGLAKYELNLTRIVSRPYPGRSGEYVFLVDFEGDRRNPNVKQALAEVKAHTTFLRALGTFAVIKKLRSS